MSGEAPAQLGFGAATNLGVTTAKSFAGTTGITLSTQQPVAAGSAIVVLVGTNGNTPPTSCTDASGNTYTAVSTPTTGSVVSTIFYCTNCLALPSGSALTVVWPSGTIAAGQFFAYAAPGGGIAIYDSASFVVAYDVRTATNPGIGIGSVPAGEWIFANLVIQATTADTFT